MFCNKFQSIIQMGNPKHRQVFKWATPTIPCGIRGVGRSQGNIQHLNENEFVSFLIPISLLDTLDKSKFFKICSFGFYSFIFWQFATFMSLNHLEKGRIHETNLGLLKRIAQFIFRLELFSKH